MQLGVGVAALKTLKVLYYATPSTLIYASGLQVNLSNYEKRCTFYYTPIGNTCTFLKMVKD